MEYRVRRHDGEYQWLMDNGIPLFGNGEEFIGYIGSCVDITDRKRGEGVLRLKHSDSSSFEEVTV
jgi:PAS domain S-box-containing protein